MHTNKHTGPVRIDLTFSVNTNPHLVLVLMSITEEVIMMDKNRNFLVNFKL